MLKQKPYDPDDDDPSGTEGKTHSYIDGKISFVPDRIAATHAKKTVPFYLESANSSKLDINKMQFFCLFMIDNSSSMTTASLAAASNGLNMYRKVVNERLQYFSAFDYGCLFFNENQQTFSGWVPIRDPVRYHLVAEGKSEMSSALECGLTLIEERRQIYQKHGIRYTRPCLILLTDGEPTDRLDPIVPTIRNLQKTGKLEFFAISSETHNDCETSKILFGRELMILLTADPNLAFELFALKAIARLGLEYDDFVNKR